VYNPHSPAPRSEYSLAQVRKLRAGRHGCLAIRQHQLLGKQLHRDHVGEATRNCQTLTPVSIYARLNPTSLIAAATYNFPEQKTWGEM
jgi:hypothetical protein